MKRLLSLQRSALAFPVLAVLALMLLFISEVAYRQAMASLDNLGRMSIARVDTLTLLRLMVDAETGQRGYLLTGREEYLQPYRNSIDELRRRTSELAVYYERDAAARADVIELRQSVDRKVSEMQSTLALFQDGKTDSALQLLLTDIGREQMEAVRRASTRLIDREADRIQRERAEVYTTLRLGRLGVGTMTALSLLALLLYLRQRSAVEQLRNEQRQALERERDQLEALARERTQQLTELARHLQTAREDERSRLARDLHDELGALLTAAKLDVARLKSRLPDASPEVVTRMSHLTETLNSGIAMKRRIVEDLRPSSLSNLGLVAALEILAREFGEASGLQVNTDLSAVNLSSSAELTTYRLVQEATTNIAKYAKAQSVTIRVAKHADGVEVSVTDDGIGFNPGQQHHSSAHGLLGMRFRVESEGGRMLLTTAPGEGTSIRAVLPEAPPAPADGAPAADAAGPALAR